MDSAIKSVAKQVGETNREISRLNERFGGLERTVMEIKEALAQREESGKSPLVHSLDKDELSISKRLEQFQLTESFGDDSRFDSLDETIPSMPKSVSKPKESGGTSGKMTGSKKMTEAEFQFRMEMGLCFLCDEHHTENYYFKNKHLQLQIVDDDDDLFDEDESDEEEEQKPLIGGNQNALPMNSTKVNWSVTFKFLGKIGSREVVVKIGSTAQNFISEELVAELQIPVERTKRFRVNFGFGVKREGTGVCKNVVVEAQDAEIVGRFFPTKLRIADVILGFEWMGSAGAVLYLGSPETVTFKWQERTVTLQPDPSLTKGIELGGLMTLEWDDGED